MNLDTGKVYRTAEEIAEARKRGERLAPISDHVAFLVEEGQRSLNRKERRAQAAKQRRAR